MSVYKEEKTNTWRVIYRYTDWTGQRKQSQKRGFKTKREAQAWEREQMNKATADLDMTFESFIKLYTQDMQSRIKENTWHTKENIINTKLLPYFKKRKISQITPKDIINWQNEMINYRDAKGKPYSPVYLKTLHNQLSAIFNHAVKYYGLRENPAAKVGNMGKSKSREMLFWTKETIMQVSSSKKWQSQPALDENGNPVLTAKGKPILKKSYSVLQDDFFNAMRNAGYTDVERGERGSTEEHLTVTQFKVAQESARLEILEAQVEKKEQQLQKIEQKTRVQKTTAISLAEIDGIGRKTFTGKLELTPQEGETLKQLARKGVVSDAVISDLKQKLATARKDARIWKERYEKLLEQTKDFLAAVKRAPEKVRAFLDRILHSKREVAVHRNQHETTLTK